MATLNESINNIVFYLGCIITGCAIGYLLIGGFDDGSRNYPSSMGGVYHYDEPTTTIDADIPKWLNRLDYDFEKQSALSDYQREKQLHEYDSSLSGHKWKFDWDKWKPFIGEIQSICGIGYEKDTECWEDFGY